MTLATFQVSNWHMWLGTSAWASTDRVSPSPHKVLLNNTALEGTRSRQVENGIRELHSGLPPRHEISKIIWPSTPPRILPGASLTVYVNGSPSNCTVHSLYICTKSCQKSLSPSASHPSRHPTPRKRKNRNKNSFPPHLLASLVFTSLVRLWTPWGQPPHAFFIHPAP